MDKSKIERDLRISISVIPEAVTAVVFVFAPLAMRVISGSDIQINPLIFSPIYAALMFLMYVKNEFVGMRFLKKYFPDEYEYRLGILYKNRTPASLKQYHDYIDSMFKKPKQYDVYLVNFYYKYENKISINTMLFIGGIVMIFLLYGIILG